MMLSGPPHRPQKLMLKNKGQTMNRIRQITRKSITRTGLAIIAALIIALIAVPLASAKSPARYVLRAGGFRSSAGSSNTANMRITGELGHSGPGAMTSENYAMTSPLAAAGIICIIEFDDFTLFADQWLDTGIGLRADLDNDRDVDFADLDRFAHLWLNCCPKDWPLR